MGNQSIIGSWCRWLLPTCLLVLAVAVWLLPPGREAEAHANLARANPSPNSVLEEPPARAAIWFTEPIEPSLSEVRVLDSRGAQVDDGNVLADRNDPTAISVGLVPLPDGTYTVAWKNVSTVDGHRVRGSFLFSIGQPISGAPVEAPDEPLLQSLAEPVLRWLILTGVLAMAGGLLFELLVWRPTLLARQANASLRRAGALLASRSSKLVWAGIALLLGASLAQLLLQTSLVHEISIGEAIGAPVKAMLTGTEWGRLWLWRFGLILAFALVLFAAPRLVQDAAGQRQQAAKLLALGLGGGILWTLSLTSHGAATPEIRSFALTADFIHLLAAAFWVGGLFHFALGAPVVMSALSPRDRLACLVAMTPRFSTVASLSVGALIVTGVFSAWAQVTTPPAIQTAYGAVLVAKIVMVVPLLLLGGLNLVWVRPRLTRGEDATRWLKRFLLGEAALALLVLASVGVLTSLEPARQVASREGIGVPDSLTFRESVEGTDIGLNVRPGRVGPNDITVSLADRLGAPITGATDVTVRLTYLEADLGEEAAPAVSAGNGDYRLEGAPLSISGPWQAEIAVRRSDAFDARTAFRFEAVPSGVADSSAISPGTATAGLLLGAGLALLGMVFMGASLPLGGWFTRAGAGVMLPGLAGFAVGVVLLFNSQLSEPEGLVRNPFPPNTESLQTGQTVYGQNCQTCHGAGGRGDGPSAAGLQPPPANLIVHVPLHGDHDLFRFVTDGIPGTAMAPLGATLTDEEIWHVVNYIKTLE